MSAEEEYYVPPVLGKVLQTKRDFGDTDELWAIIEFLAEKIDKLIEPEIKQYSECCNAEVYYIPNSWKSYCSGCRQSCLTHQPEKGEVQ